MRNKEAGDRAHPRWAERRTGPGCRNYIGQSNWVPLQKADTYQRLGRFDELTSHIIESCWAPKSIFAVMCRDPEENFEGKRDHIVIFRSKRKKKEKQ